MIAAMIGLMMATAPTDGAALRTQLEAVAGQPVRLDPRIRIPDCASGYRLERRPTAVDASCADNGWRLVVPVAGGDGRTSDEPLVRRGSAVVVEASGTGFAVRVDAVAEADAGIGDMVRVRNARSGQRVLARIAADGRLLMDER